MALNCLSINTCFVFSDPMVIRRRASSDTYEIDFYFRNSSNHGRFMCTYSSRPLYESKYECGLNETN